MEAGSAPCFPEITMHQEPPAAVAPCMVPAGRAGLFPPTIFGGFPMFQDIYPHIYHNEFSQKPADADDFILIFSNVTVIKIQIRHALRY